MIIEEIKDQSQPNYFFRISDGYLFIRSEDEYNFNITSAGQQGKTARFLKIQTEEETIGESINRDRLRKNYGLQKNFNLKLKCYEFVIVESRFSGLKNILKKIISENPHFTIRQIFNTEYESMPEKKKVGRQKVYRDSSTGKIIGVKQENLKIIELWEAGNNFEGIRLSIHPTTKTPPRKSLEIRKIKRKLREYNHLLVRKYDRK